MKLKDVLDFNITEDGWVSYKEEVLNDIDRVQMLRENIREVNSLDMHLNKFTDREVFKQWCRRELEKEKLNCRLIEYSFNVSRIKSFCVDCRSSLGETQEELIYNNIQRGNYCPACNARYGI